MKRIMLADDDPGIVEAVKMILEFEGYDVITSNNGSTVLKMPDDSFDLLLLDRWMSGEDGRDVCMKFKKNPQTKNIPVIMFSASRDVEQSALNAGADDFLAKPFDMTEMFKKIKNLLNV